jgi:limonene-1,2-epoxide hydrolase
MSLMQDTLRSIMTATQAQDNEGFLAHLADDIDYVFHVGSPGVRGKDGVRRFLAKYRTIAQDVVWRVDRIAESADCLFMGVTGVHRQADRTASRTRTWASWVPHGKIRHWRDYFEDQSDSGGQVTHGRRARIRAACGGPRCLGYAIPTIVDTPVRGSRTLRILLVGVFGKSP